MLGRVLAHYEIIEKLGEGGMGVVYKAHDSHLDRLVSLKLLPADKVADPDRRRRFVQEARAASALNRGKPDAMGDALEHAQNIGYPQALVPALASAALIDYLEGGETIDDFLAGFPTVKQDQVVAFLEEP